MTGAAMVVMVESSRSMMSAIRTMARIGPRGRAEPRRRGGDPV